MPVPETNWPSSVDSKVPAVTVKFGDALVNVTVSTRGVGLLQTASEAVPASGFQILPEVLAGLLQNRSAFSHSAKSSQLLTNRLLRISEVWVYRPPIRVSLPDSEI